MSPFLILSSLFYVSTRYDINQHFYDEQVEWIEVNVEVFEQAVLAGCHFLWLEPFTKHGFNTGPRTRMECTVPQRRLTISSTARRYVI